MDCIEGHVLLLLGFGRTKEGFCGDGQTLHVMPLCRVGLVCIELDAFVQL